MMPKILIPAGLLVVGLAVFALVWFEPQALFINQKVDESAPPTRQIPTSAPTVQETVQVLALSGSFRSLAHQTSGQAILERDQNGQYFVRFENFETENGPDVRVYLSAAEGSAEGDELIRDFIDLGALKGNIGNQNYDVPAGVDVSKFRSAVVWCRRFKVGFGVAPLDPLTV